MSHTKSLDDTIKPVALLHLCKGEKDIAVEYTNYRGERSIRLLRPIHFYYGITEYHQDQQWLMSAYDHAKQALRTFAMRDIRTWRG